VARLLERYKTEVRAALAKEFGVENQFAVPRLTKIVISMGLGKAIAEKRRLEIAVEELGRITGQKPQVCKAKKSVSNFKLRQGMEIGAKVTLRGPRMYEFLDRLINLAIPRVRDFRGLSPNSFDGRGSYNMGLAEQTVFPEIDADKVEFTQGMNVTMVTTAPSDEQARRLLQLLGMPFREK
jgi:large subunit ribosomal protein L5